MSKKCRAYSESKLGLEPPDNRKSFYAGWDAALEAAMAQEQAEPVQDSGFWGRVAARQASRIKQLETAAQQALEALEWHYRQGHSNTLGGFRLKIDEKALRELRAAMAQQDEPVEPVDVGLLEYRGNSVAFIHQKMTAYQPGIDAAWDAFRANGLHPDGKTPLADMIAKHTAPPQRTMVPLTEEEIDAEWRELDGEVSTMFMRVLRKFARAVEKASWEKNHGKA